MNRNTAILLGFVVLKLALQYFLISPEYDLHRDEYLHLDQGRHLAWGYLSVPPFTSWVSWVIHLLGGGVFWVRLVPALFGVLTILTVWKTVEALGGDLFARILAATCVLFSVLLRLNQLYQPNSADVLGWTLLYFTLIRYTATLRPGWIYAAGVVFAFSFLNKYNIAFLAVGLVPAWVLTAQRKIFLDKHLYLAALLALVLVLPNLVWQYANHFPVFHHMKELAATQLVNVSRADFLKEQLIYFSGSWVVIAAALYALLTYKPFASWRFLFFSIFITLAVFLFLRAKGYYAIGLYPIYIAFGSVFLSNRVKGRWAAIIRPALVILPVLLFIPLYRIAFPNKRPQAFIDEPERYRKVGMLRWEDGREHPLPQDFADMLGWKELAAKVDKAYAASPDPAATLVLCDNYGQAGAINFYTRRHVQAVSFNADYVFWFDLKTKYRHLIRVKTWPENKLEMAETGPFFQQGFATGAVTNRYAREQGTTVFLFLNAKTDINARIRKEVAEARERYRE
ncbi:ArnT family glycosyltransferase [Dyadobacter sandarakinus]|uniref:Glycosyltransferase family 39 protein n=1 Tax=Dyadobacter sandarakinus TaxID=2747268 RepID=A0ABX7I3G3_9BACT|nr:glycosyltransferase family 39 protein [Dyadobacter sandarakinus]QRR00626.1 glycosyltransferase family 39 protein [Dyadobacter sandarakinus]